MKSQIIFQLAIPLIETGRVIAGQSCYFQRKVKLRHLPTKGSEVYIGNEDRTVSIFTVTDVQFQHYFEDDDVRQMIYILIALKNLMATSDETVLKIFQTMKNHPEWTSV